MLPCLGKPPLKSLCCCSSFHFWSSFCYCSSFCCFSSFVDVLHSHFHCDIIPHPSVDYLPGFTPILYFQPSPLQSDSRHFHFQPFRCLLTASVTVLIGHFLPTGIFFTLRFFTDILPAFIKVSLGAGSSSSLKFAGVQTDPWNTDPARLFVWFAVIHNLHTQNDLVLNTTKHYHESLVVKV